MRFTLSKTIQSRVDLDFFGKITEDGRVIIIDPRALKGTRTSTCQEQMKKRRMLTVMLKD